MATKVLLTGGSSFTGVWIAEALAQAGFEVVAPLLRQREDYEGVRLDRVARLEKVAVVTYGRTFGSQALLDDIRAAKADVLAHHAAHITGYRSPDFDPVDALARNTAGAAETLAAVRRAGGRLMVLTGSVFEAGEGGGEEPGAVTPYGLSKTLTTSAFDYWARSAGLAFGRFVIPSPYGVLEEKRFGWHLFRSWFAGETPAVRTPLYVRDHLAAPRLAMAYAEYVAAILQAEGPPAPCRPSGWIAPQGDLALKTAAEAARRLGRECPVELGEQARFDEPRVRVNDQPQWGPSWDEGAFWDAYVEWYAGLHRAGALT